MILWWSKKNTLARQVRREAEARQAVMAKAAYPTVLEKIKEIADSGDNSAALEYLASGAISYAVAGLLRNGGFDVYTNGYSGRVWVSW